MTLDYPHGLGQKENCDYKWGEVIYPEDVAFNKIKIETDDFINIFEKEGEDDDKIICNIIMLTTCTELGKTCMKSVQPFPTEKVNFMPFVFVYGMYFI